MSRNNKPNRDNRDSSQDEFKRNDPVVTKDGVGRVLGRVLIKSSNKGPGNWGYLVRLDDGRERRYSQNTLIDASRRL